MRCRRNVVFRLSNPWSNKSWPLWTSRPASRLACVVSHASTSFSDHDAGGSTSLAEFSLASMVLYL